MFALDSIIRWLLESCCLTTLILAIGWCLAGRCRSKNVRLRVLQWTLASTMACLLLLALPGSYRLALPVTMLHPTRVEREPIAPPNTLSQAAPRTTAIEAPITRPSLPDQALANPQPSASASVATAETPKAPSASKWSSSTFAALPWLMWSKVLLVSLFFVGSGWTVLRWCLARWQLHNLVRRSTTVPASVERELKLISNERAGCVEVRASSEIVSPITWGCMRPVIMLPNSLLSEQERANLRYSLAHEWAHVAAFDSVTWTLLNWLQFALYYHPLVWLLRRQVLLTMDQLADATAAQLADSPADYAEFLVQLARARQLPSSPLALAVSDPHSMLRKRVEFLIEHNPLARRRCSLVQHAMIASAAIGLVCIGTAVQREPIVLAAAQEPQPQEPANQPNENPPGKEQTSNQPQPTDAPNTTDKDLQATATELVSLFVNGAKPGVTELLKYAVQERPDGSIIYHGFVVDQTTELPIVGAEVTVYHKLSQDPKTNDWSTIEVTQHTTNLIGMYSFVLPPEQTAQSSLYIEVEVHHPKYASMGRAGYSHDMIRKNLKLGELPFYTGIKLWPGEAVEGTLVNNAGQPVAGAEVSIYSKSPQAKDFGGGSFDKVKSDAQGRFRIVPATPGDGALWISPDEYAPQAYGLADRRGDWGKIVLEKGTDVPGQVLDVDGKPVANVRIDARRRGDGEKVDEFLKSNAVANHIGRVTVTDAEGRFKLASLPEGDYNITIEPNSESYDPPQLEHVFLQHSFKVDQGKAEPQTIRALPQVVLHGTYLNSRNEPRGGHEVMAFGKLGQQYFFARSENPGKDGKFLLRLPHGLRDVKLNLITNEHSSLKFRFGREDKLKRGQQANLGTVEDDIHGFEIVRYAAPVLLVKVVDADGKTITDAPPVLNYMRPIEDGEEMSNYTVGGHVSFELQGDGRYRSSSLLPDEAFPSWSRKMVCSPSLRK